MILKRNFYNRPTLEVAKDLLGCFIIRKVGDKLIRARIVEVEAYIGQDDLACHASKGRTPRTEIMYGKGGFAYVYLIYGMYFCFNIITEREGFPAGVFIRAVEIEGEDFKKTNGPGKLCRHLQINKTLHGTDLTLGRKIWIEKGIKNQNEGIITTPRIGIDYAKHCIAFPWRFLLKKK